MTKVAILIDGAFFIKRLRYIYKTRPGFDSYGAEFFARELYTIALKHLNLKKHEKNECLYRILYYDCYPLDKRVHNPISTKCLNFAKTKEAAEKMGSNLET